MKLKYSSQGEILPQIGKKKKNITKDTAKIHQNTAEMELKSGQTM